jgi:hypothetical protein
MAIFEYTVYVGRRYAAHFFVRDSDDIVGNIRENIAHIMQKTGQSKSAIMQEILEAGIQTLMEDLDKPKRQVLWERENNELLKIYAQRERLRALREICALKGKDSFIAWAQESGYSNTDINQAVGFHGRDISDREWLQVTLLDGPMKTSDIKERALKQGIITEDPKDWARLSQAAKRLGYTGKQYGYWEITAE